MRRMKILNSTTKKKVASRRKKKLPARQLYVIKCREFFFSSVARNLIFELFWRFYCFVEEFAREMRCLMTANPQFFADRSSEPPSVHFFRIFSSQNQV